MSLQFSNNAIVHFIFLICCACDTFDFNKKYYVGIELFVAKNNKTPTSLFFKKKCKRFVC